MLETLTPAERLAYVLHDMFSVPFEEIGAILDRSPEAARQLASRGRRRIRRRRRVSLLHGRIYAIGALSLRKGRITTMDILLDPPRLARLDLTAFDSRR